MALAILFYYLAVIVSQYKVKNRINNAENIADGWWRDARKAADLNSCVLDWKLLIRNCSELNLSVIKIQTSPHSILIKQFNEGPGVQFTMCSNHEFAVNKLSKLEKWFFSHLLFSCWQKRQVNQNVTLRYTVNTMIQLKLPHYEVLLELFVS